MLSSSKYDCCSWSFCRILGNYFVIIVIVSVRMSVTAVLLLSSVLGCWLLLSCPCYHQCLVDGCCYPVLIISVGLMVVTILALLSTVLCCCYPGLFLSRKVTVKAIPVISVRMTVKAIRVISWSNSSSSPRLNIQHTCFSSCLQLALIWLSLNKSHSILFVYLVLSCSARGYFIPNPYVSFSLLPALNIHLLPSLPHLLLSPVHHFHWCCIYFLTGFSLGFTFLSCGWC